ncbi:migration and invasion-inhibitory protein [Pyrgilauda ruficollis]|uniref:migration and invasion-inhibitory protein n=1 Tax=Pyrgilauda ruficollis TaxID=221976 RepID=UPI001B87DDC9|nr:migration and invasion-inhibitory protein [Pyrgilauda ruficollis]XP_041332457.1 migration and invasion-inhibitory protein [Pyrgilauda ruficollis]XP_041332458.1 migration and invasion-inhibitory protein [Pyrgilauda ruficollis]XP_041332459.1 migration and invasion-inhibitory protein [Pyrgilauda ruficollis]XP_041332460.1 migration and invasion-inhibitory protein [Pyrgilauda ruficollis]XP_041332461.1 migration and invasion-inhibitory protein [Pyrgilauda ruficollis]XP_041332462.1 migration and 
MDSELLNRLRQANQELLQRLRIKQEEIRKGLPSKKRLPAALHGSPAAERWIPLSSRVKENEADAVKSTADPGIMVSVESRGGPALSSSLKHSSSARGLQQQQAKAQEGAGLNSNLPGKGKSVVPVSAVTTCGREVSRVDGDGGAQGSPEKKSFFLGHGENRKHSALLRGFHGKSHPGPSQNKDTSKKQVVTKEPRVPKSALLMSPSKQPKKEARHVTFQSDPEEDAIPVSSWSAHPLLGYDWIAGLLDTKSPVTEKSEQYFAELHEFRQSNRETCIHQQHLEPEALDCTSPEEELDLIIGSHKCVYCYGLNQRLFTIPADAESACPVCKIPRSQQPPGTLEEPAYVRVSIPRSALLPAHKYKAHRRRSFEPADDLALPSHCMAGWENMVPSSSTLLSSLDLRASLEEKPSPCPHLDSVSRVSGKARTDKFLHLPHLAH